MCMYKYVICMCVYIYIYTYVYQERERGSLRVQLSQACWVIRLGFDGGASSTPNASAGAGRLLWPVCFLRDRYLVSRRGFRV